MVNINSIDLNFLETPRKLIIANLSFHPYTRIFISAVVYNNEDQSFQIESFAIIIHVVFPKNYNSNFITKDVAKLSLNCLAFCKLLVVVLVTSHRYWLL